MRKKTSFKYESHTSTTPLKLILVFHSYCHLPDLHPVASPGTTSKTAYLCSPAPFLLAPSLWSCFPNHATLILPMCKPAAAVQGAMVCGLNALPRFQGCPSLGPAAFPAYRLLLHTTRSQLLPNRAVPFPKPILTVCSWSSFQV